MLVHFAQRLGMTLLVAFLAISINFLIPRAMPGDPIEQQLSQLSASSGGNVGDIQAMVQAYRERFGLDAPLWRQYLNYLADVVRGDWGYSLVHYPERVSDVIAAGLPWTLGLLGAATLISFSIGTLLGGLLAWPGSSRLVRVLGVPVILLSAVPYFILGIVLMFVFGLTVPILPVAGGYSFGFTPAWNWATVGQVLQAQGEENL